MEIKVILTKAPGAYDYGYCKSYDLADGWRRVIVPADRAQYQYDRYWSGMYATKFEEE